MKKSAVNFFIFLILLLISINGFGQKLAGEFNAKKSFGVNFNLPVSDDKEIPSTINTTPYFENPIILKTEKGCHLDNLKDNRFDSRLSKNDRLIFCEAVQDISQTINGNWSFELSGEIKEVWQIFLSENIIIRPMKEGVSSKIVAAAEAFTEPGRNFNASFYIRPELVREKSFLFLFMHEMRHIYDFYAMWKAKTSLTQAELEKRGFRLMSRIYQEVQKQNYPKRVPVFFDENWKKLSLIEIEKRRDQKIEKFMRGNSLYKRLLKNPEKYRVGFVGNQGITQNADFESAVTSEEKNGIRLPNYVLGNQPEGEIPQKVKELSFTTEKPAHSNDPNELLRATITNEKNLYQKMDNFVYDQNLQFQCWQKEQVVENYQTKNLVVRTKNGETLLQNLMTLDQQAKENILPDCVANFEVIKTDATETFWSAPYLDKMPVKFEYFTELDGIRVARYTVLQPTSEKYNEIAALYPKIKPFRVFVGTLFVNAEDAQIIKFWGTSYPDAVTASNQAQPTISNYCATALRRKLNSGIWVTVILNTVALSNQNGKINPFSYIVNYENYRQGVTDVQILDDNQTGVK